jgi:hypothetical protein
VFPDVYNEDWFAFAAEAHVTGVAHVGNVSQIEYNPFEDPQRAAFEEFGDLIAEGIYALFNDGYGLSRATMSYWNYFLDARLRFVEEVHEGLNKGETHERVQALKSLQEASARLAGIHAWDCMDFLTAWQHDRDRFTRLGRQISGPPRAYDDAFAALGVQRWQEARFGVVKMPPTATITPVGVRR